MFFFKDLEESGLNVKKRAAHIKELLEITGAAPSKYKTLQKKSTKENKFDEIFESSKKKDSEIIDDDFINDEVKIYNPKSKKNVYKSQKISNKEKATDKEKIIGKRGKGNEVKIISRNDKDEFSDNFEGASSNNRGSDIRSNYNMNMNMGSRKKLQRYKEYSESKIETSKEDPNMKEEISPEEIKYDFNICEVIGASIFKCCLPKELEIKRNLNEKANSILYSKLDIVLYVRNMILFDIINETFLGIGVKHIINFLSRPIISLNGKEQDKLSMFYHSYKSSDFNKLYDEINQLSQKSNKISEEIELISLTNKHLKRLIV